MDQELKERFAAAWDKHRELQDGLNTVKEVNPEHLNDWAKNFIAERSKEVNAIAELLNQENEAGLVMVEAWLAARKRHAETLHELFMAQDNLRFYREWMAWRGGVKLDESDQWVDHAYIKQIDAKFQKFIKYRYWTFGDEKYPDEEGYVAPEDED